MNAVIKLCIDCKWSRSDQGSSVTYLKCENPDVVGISPVDGKPEISYCSTQRVEWLLKPSLCGPEGKRFEPKEITI